MSDEATPAPAPAEGTTLAPAPAPAPVEAPAADAPAAELSPRDAAIAILKKANASPPEAGGTDSPADESAAQPPPAEPKPAEPKPDPMAQKFEALRQAERRLQSERAKLKTEQDETRTILQARDLAKKDPLAFMQAHGLTYEQVTDFVLNGKKPTAEMETSDIRRELEALKAERTREKEDAARQQQEYVVQSFKQEMLQKAASDERFELAAVHGRDAVELAWAALDAYVAENGTMPGGSKEAAIEFALQHVEALYEENAQALLKTKKLQGRLPSAAPKPASPQRPQASNGQKQSAAPRTLTNSQAAVAQRSAPEKPLSVDELRAQAARILRTGKP